MPGVLLGRAGLPLGPIALTEMYKRMNIGAARIKQHKNVLPLCIMALGKSDLQPTLSSAT